MNKFLKGAAILSIAGILIKVIGVFFRIPLTNWVGADGLSYYSSAYVIYSFMLTISTAGIPTAISRMVAERIAFNNYYGAKRVFRVALVALASLGFVSFLIMFFGADFIAEHFLSNPGANISIRAIAPAVLIVPIMSAYRGYFQGMQNMVPTALSQFVEQIFRVGFGLYIAYILLPKGNEYVSAGATAGCSIGGLFGLITISLIYLKNKKKQNLLIENYSKDAKNDSIKTIIKEILVIIVPITISSGVFPLVNMIDAMIVMGRLQATGWTYAEAKLLWGRLGGYCDSLIGLPSVFINSIVMCILPMVASTYKKNDLEGTNKNSEFAVKISSVISIPCAVGLFVLAYDVLKLLYPAENIAQEVADAVPTLRILCITVILSAFTSCFGAILNGIGKQVQMLIFVICGGVIKIISTYVFVGIPFLNINGAPMATICCDLVIVVLDMIAIKKYLGYKLHFVGTFLKPLIGSIVMGLAVYGVSEILSDLPRVINVGVSVIVGVIVYAISILLLKMLTKEEILSLPKGDRIVGKIGKFLK